MAQRSFMVRYLRQCQQLWLGFSLKGFKPVAPTEQLRRFITEKRQIDKKTNKPKPQAFLPRPADGCTSTYRVPASAGEKRLWALGRSVAAGGREGVLYGQASIAANRVTAQDLVLRLGRLPSLHVDITGWPQKPRQLLIAEKLVKDAVLIPAP
jgi:hypothetical protein